MRPTIIFLLVVAGALALGILTGCHPVAQHTRAIEEANWELNGTANPLDTPKTYVNQPEAMGTFGPHAEYFRFYD